MSRWLLPAALVLVFAQGLVRVAIIPLWRHYDEPAHYEYVRFVVEHGRLPRIGDADPAILDRIAATDRSIVPCHSLEGPFLPGTCVATGNAFIQPPGYYVLQAAVQRVVEPRTVEGQVRLARLVSVILSVGVAWLAFLIVKVVRPGDTDLALTVAALLGAVPGYVDLMSALSNDVGAVTGLSLLVFATVRLIQRGIHPGTLAAVVAAAGLCVGLKATAAIGVPLASVGIWLAAWPRLRPWLRWAGPAVAMPGAMLLAMDLGWPAHWFSYVPFPAVRRVEVATPWGRHAISVTESGKHKPVLWQPIPEEGQRALRGRTATLGAWVRSPDGTRQAPLPIVGGGMVSREGPSVAATPEWSFHSHTVSVPPDDVALAVYIPEVRAGVAQYSGIVLVPGVRPAESLPRPDDHSAKSGVWAGTRFVNLLTNASAEDGWPVLRPRIDERAPGGGLNYRLPSLYDPRGWPAYWSAMRWQFITYWTGFGTGAAYGPRVLYVALGLLTAVSLLGMGARVLRGPWPGATGSVTVRCLAFLILTVASSLVMSFLRIDPPDAAGRIVHPPTARYGYVSIVPAMSLLALGWGAWWPARWRRRGLTALVLGILAVGLWLLVAVQVPCYRS